MSELTPEIAYARERDQELWQKGYDAGVLAATPPQADRGLREALDAWERNGAPNRKSLAAFGLAAALRDTPPAGLDVEALGEAIFRVGTGFRQRETATIPARIANSQDGAKASGEFAELVAAEYERLAAEEPGS